MYNDFHITTCSFCGKKFRWVEKDDIYPGCKEMEDLYCPYCSTVNSSWMTSGSIRSYKMEEDDTV